MSKRYPRHSRDEVDVALTEICGKDRGYSHDTLLDLMKLLGFEREALGRGNNGNVRMTAGILLRSAIKSGKLTVDKIRVAKDGGSASDAAATPPDPPVVAIGTTPATDAAVTPAMCASPGREMNLPAVVRGLWRKLREVEGSGSATWGAAKQAIASVFRDLFYLRSILSLFHRPPLTIARLGEKHGRKA